MNISPIRGRMRRATVTLMVTLGLLVAAAPVGTATAATTSGYPTASAQYMASARTQPYLNNTYWGYVLHNPGGTGNQTVSVKCWWDGDWATGNYRTNRWFRVLVWESYDGYPVPRWLFVHASYVYNQPTVPRCTSTPVGIE